MKILVLGASGQVGSELATQLENVLSVAGQNYSLVLASRAEVDVADLPALRDFLKLHSSDWIVNATAYTAVDNAENEVSQAYMVNEHAVHCLAEYCRSQKARLVHISTDYVFDGDGVNPFGETHPVSPLGIYGTSKLAGEDTIRNTLSAHIILRTAWVFGATGNNFVKTMLRLAESRAELGVVGDQFGSPTSARGIAKTIAILMSQMLEAADDDARWGTYHYSGYPFVSWADFASEIFHQAHEKSMIKLVPAVNAITTEEYPTPAKRPKNSRLDCSKIHGAFGVEPDDWRRSLSDMLDEIKGVSG